MRSNKEMLKIMKETVELNAELNRIKKMIDDNKAICEKELHARNKNEITIEGHTCYLNIQDRNVFDSKEFCKEHKDLYDAFKVQKHVEFVAFK